MTNFKPCDSVCPSDDLCSKVRIFCCCCWAPPILHTSEVNPKVEVVRKLASDCPHLKCCFAGVPFSATNQIPYYLHQFLDVSFLRKIIPRASLSEVKEPSLVEIDLMAICLKALRWWLLFGSSVGRNVALVNYYTYKANVPILPVPLPIQT